MSIVCGLDLHYEQITFDAMDSVSGDVSTTPAAGAPTVKCSARPTTKPPTPLLPPRHDHPTNLSAEPGYFQPKLRAVCRTRTRRVVHQSHAEPSHTADLREDTITTSSAGSTRTAWRKPSGRGARSALRTSSAPSRSRSPPASACVTGCHAGETGT
jgi:hypothetical protein